MEDFPLVLDSGLLEMAEYNKKPFFFFFSGRRISVFFFTDAGGKVKDDSRDLILGMGMSMATPKT